MTMALGFVLLILATFFTAVGQICFKIVAKQETSFFRKFLHPTFLSGVFLFVCCPVLSSLAAKVLDFSIMYAMTSLIYVFILFLSRWILKETVDWLKIVGVSVVVVGLLVMVSA